MNETKMPEGNAWTTDAGRASDPITAEPIRPGKYELYCTAGVYAAMQDNEPMQKAISEAVARFNRGEWGNMPANDCEANNAAILAHDGRIVARYDTPCGAVYIILNFDDSTEAKDLATLMLVEEY